jgi:hypothetical protein
MVPPQGPCGISIYYPKPSAAVLQKAAASFRAQH